jgi:pyruvate,water dikinase
MFTGVFRTDVNVRGYDDLVTAIKKIYASVFKDAVVVYARKNDIDLSQLRMAVVVQKMVQAEVSGITYTKDPITQDKNKISMEAVFGLGDVIANGEITPDRYVMNKKDLSFEEKHISPQEWMRVRMLNTKGKGGSDKIKISSAWSHQQKLEDRFLKDIAKLSLIVEESTGFSQNIEWVWESGRVWIIQNKPLVDTPVLKEILSSEKSSVAVLDPAMEIMKEKLDEKQNEEVVNDMQRKAVEKAVKSVKPEVNWTEKIQKITEKIERKENKD